MPWILWRHLLSELLKVLLLTASVIVVVVAFGAAIKPLAESSIGPGSVLKYIALATVPMMQFALPFAAGFAATIVIHRFAADNELVAMAASGLRHRSILMPVAGVGVALFAAMLWLVSSVVPQFWGLMRETAAQDAAAVFVAAVERGEALDVGDVTLYADAVQVEPAPADTGASQRLRLAGVAAVKRSRGKDGSTEVLSEFAIVDIHRREGATVMKLSMSQGTGFRADEGTVAFIPQATPDAVELGRAVERDARSTTTSELRAIRAAPDQEPAVRQAMANAASVLDRVDLLDCMQRTLAGTGSVTMVDDVSGRRYRMDSARSAGPALVAGSSPMQVTELDGARPVRRATAARGSLLRASAGEGNRVDLVLEAASALDLGGSSPTPTRWPNRLRDLRVLECPSAQQGMATSGELLDRLDALVAGAGPNAQEGAAAATELRARIGKLDRDASSNMQQRLALSASAPLVLLLGTALAAWKRSSMPLTIYLLAFLPALLNIVMIAGGQQVMRGGAVVPGLALMWLGNGLLLALFIHAYRQWARH
jgi:lipopolysaccharide export LptBFGC system permease protein LptF